MLSKGVLIPAFHKRGYVFAAYNLAAAIKHFNPEIKVALLHDAMIQQINTDVFDLLIPMNDADKYTAGKLDPAKVKLSIYDKLPFDETLVLDADCMCISSIEKIFTELTKEDGNYFTHVKRIFSQSEEPANGAYDWADSEDIYSHFKIDSSASLPITNSSFQYIKKSPQAKELFTRALHNLSNPIPIARLKHTWGDGTGQPDELYLNIAMAQLGITGQTEKKYMHLGNEYDGRSITKLSEDVPLVAMLGYNHFTKVIYREYYDRLKFHKYKWLYIGNDKYANAHSLQTSHRTTSRPRAVQRQTVEGIKPGLIPISSTIKIDSGKLIKGYALPNGNKFRVTNWLNCSFIEFKGRKYFAYRMEAQPFCVNMKIGICLLDDDLQPIAETNVLLHLHSDLKGYNKNYHVEDPRLFIFNDELYLSYTDGYQMAQAKINPDTLRAEESFYIDKVNEARTEKNWTFFEEGKKLMCVYDISNNEIFEMNGSKFKAVSKSDKPIKWNYGELRGGSTPIRVGEKYLSFFHSSTPVTVRGRLGSQYHMGCYEFESKFPYTITRITDKPIISGEQMSENVPRLSNRIYVVFPSGTIKTENGFKVSFGYNDFECRYVTVSNELLEQTLKPL